MPSFDIVSEVDKHELQNAIDQAKREVDNRFDFKGVDTKIELSDKELTIAAPSDFQIKQLVDIVENKLVKRDLDPKCLDFRDPEVNVQETRQVAEIKQGIDQATAKKITKLVKEEKMKVQASIQGEKIRVTGKKRDDLQAVIALLRDQDLGVALQYDNFRD